MSNVTTHTRESIRDLLARNDRAVQRAILVLYGRQTNDEQSTEETRHDNSVGFNQPDARRMSYFARWIESGRSLDGKHLEDARRRVMKYGRQLAEIANEKAAAS